MRHLLLKWIIIMTLGTTAQAAPLSATDDEILEILTARIDEQKQSVGIVVGIIDAAGQRVVAHGHLEKDDPRPIDGNTVFEIGSVTKVFTALALADAAERGGVQLDTPVSQLLPESVVLRQAADGKPITLKHLATHMSGLPRLPDNLMPADENDPYADYGVAKLYAFLSTHQPTRPPGGEHEYSNLGYGLLGHVLALRSGQSYEALVRERITIPLGMVDTAITARPEWEERRATGHDAGLEPTSDWDLGALPGAGALRSTTNDLLTFLQAAMGKKPSPWRQRLPRRLRRGSRLATAAKSRHSVGSSPAPAKSRSSGTMAAPAATDRSSASAPRLVSAWWCCRTLRRKSASTTSACICSIARGRSHPPRFSASPSPPTRQPTMPMSAPIGWRPVSI